MPVSDRDELSQERAAASHLNSLLEGDNSVIVAEKKQKSTTMEISWENLGGVKGDAKDNAENVQGGGA